jgi:LAS superfamily LD-carboxypeptidase LdcB
MTALCRIRCEDQVAFEERIFMASALTSRQLTGLDDGHLVTLADGHRLRDEVAQAFIVLQADARQAGFELTIASSFRSFARQLAIWNGKADGTRAVHDDEGCVVPMTQLSPLEQLHAILRFSAIPGTSRHHWGTDLDVFDAAVLPAQYQLQLSLQEVAPGGLFDPMHRWLDKRMAADASHGFYRPYDKDRGGVAPERWHLSYAPLSVSCAQQCNAAMLATCWDCEDVSEELLLRTEIEANWPHLMARYVQVPRDWCAASKKEASAAMNPAGRQTQ